MRTILAMSVLLLLPSAGGPAAATEEGGSKAWEAQLDLHIVDRLLQVSFELRPDMDLLAEEWLPLERVIKDFPKAYQTRMPVTDPWGNPYLVHVVDNEVLVLSRGPNGLLDAFPAKDGDAPPPVPRSDANVQGDDIVLIAGDRILNGPRTVGERMKATMADLRSAATAVEEWSIDHDLYPAQVDSLAPLDVIRSALTPLYIRHLPTRDAWGNEFLYWSDEKSYIIVSAGSDGVLDRRYPSTAGWLAEAKFAGEFDDPATDIIFADGQFVQWPRTESPRTESPRTESDPPSQE